MTRAGHSRPWVALALLAVAARGVAYAEDPKPAPAPSLASDEAAAAAVAAFKEEFKAKGLKGDDRTSQRDWAMSKLVKVQHAAVVDALAQIARGGDATLRTLSVLYLGEMKALPGVAGREVLATMERNKKDVVLVLSALDSIGSLRYLGAQEALRDLLKDENFVMKKAAALAAGRTRDVRLLPDLFKILGIEMKGDDASAPVVVQEGYSWEGASASVDTGSSGDADQKAAEAKVKEQLAHNQAAASASAAAGGAGGQSVGGKGASSRSLKELAPAVLKAVKQITGQDFQTGKAIAAWITKSKDWLADERKRVEAEAKRQAEEK